MHGIPAPRTPKHCNDEKANPANRSHMPSTKMYTTATLTKVSCRTAGLYLAVACREPPWGLPLRFFRTSAPVPQPLSGDGRQPLWAVQAAACLKQQAAAHCPARRAQRPAACRRTQALWRSHRTETRREAQEAVLAVDAPAGGRCCAGLPSVPHASAHACSPAKEGPAMLGKEWQAKRKGREVRSHKPSPNPVVLK